MSAASIADALLISTYCVDGEGTKTPAELEAALGRARRKMADGKPYLIDVEVARHGSAWTDDHWVPTRG